MRAATALLLGLALSSPSLAAEVWSTAPLGTSLGLPTGAAPPPGMYLNLSTATITPPGGPTAQSPAAQVTAAGITYVPGIKILGGDYSASIRPAEITPFTLRR